MAIENGKKVISIGGSAANATIIQGDGNHVALGGAPAAHPGDARTPQSAAETGRAARCTVLFLAANPVAADPKHRLALDEEARDIEVKIRMAEYRDSLVLRTKWAVRTDDLIQALNEDRPTIVHFSGHGAGVPGLLFHDDEGGVKLVPADALKLLFTTLKDDIRIVVLNACYSLEQARSIAEAIDCVVGMNDSVGDEAARKFAASFYRALAFGRTVTNAFNQGLSAIAMAGLKDRSVPTLLMRGGVNPDAVRIVATP